MGIDPSTGLPTDDNGNIISAEQAGSDQLGSEQPGKPVDFSQYLDPDAPGLVDMTDQGNTAPAPGTAPVAPLAKASISSSKKGMTDVGLKRSGSIFDQADNQADAELGQFRQNRDAEVEQARRHFADLGGAVNEEARLSGEHEDRLQQLYRRQEDIQRTAADLDKHAWNESKAQGAQYIAAANEQLAGVRALMQSTGNPLASVSMGQAIGLGGAAFAQGFLAARGININVTGQIDHWVDRSIQEHQQAIANGRALAQDQLHMYDIARQSAMDDVEARARYRNMVIEALKTGTLAEAARFNSSIANAKAQGLVAQYNIEQDKTTAEIQNRYEQQYYQIHALRINEAKDKGTLAIEQERNAIEMARVKASQDKGKAASAYIPDPEVLIDSNGKPVLSPNGKQVLVNRWKVDNNLSKEQQEYATKTASDATQAFGNVIDSTDRALKSYDAAKKVRDAHPGWAKLGWEALGREDGTGAVDRFLRDRRALIMASVYQDTGKAVNENEMEQHEKQLGIDRIFAHDDGKAKVALGQFRERARNKFDRSMQIPGIIPLDANESNNPAIRYREFEGAAPKHAASDDIIIGNGDAAKTSTIQKEEGEAGRGSGKFEEGYSKSWNSYMEQQYDKSNYPDMARSIARFRKEAYEQPVWSKHMDTIAEAALAPEQVLKRHGVKDETPDQVRTDAVNALTKLMSEADTDARKAYAEWLIGRINNDPDALLKEVTPYSFTDDKED